MKKIKDELIVECELLKDVWWFVKGLQYKQEELKELPLKEDHLTAILEAIKYIQGNEFRKTKVS